MLEMRLIIRRNEEMIIQKKWICWLAGVILLMISMAGKLGWIKFSLDGADMAGLFLILWVYLSENHREMRSIHRVLLMGLVAFLLLSGMIIYYMRIR
jgi:hypothetical protein